MLAMLSDRREQVGHLLQLALDANNGAVVLLEAFPRLNDRKLARRVAEADPLLQYLSPGRPSPAMIRRVGEDA